MSTLTRDPLAQPPLRRQAAPAAGRWEWPDPAMVPPPVQAESAGRRAGPRPVLHWPNELAAWPPSPEVPAATPAAPEPMLPPEPPSISALERGQPFVAPPYSPPPLHQATSEAPRLRDPSPSRLAYRMHRLWLTPVVRHFLRLGLPALLVLALVGGWLANPDNRAAFGARVDGVVQQVQNQPMFQVGSIEVLAPTPEVAQAVEAALGLQFPLSTFDLDLGLLREVAESFDAVEHAWLQVRSGGVLEVRLQERAPALVWRHADGLDLIDATGYRVARLSSRAARPDLPLIAGEGAPLAVAEAQLLLAAALPIRARIRGLVRVGMRRWDLVLDRDQRILLPEHGALGALERVLALDAAQQLLARDVVAIDLRNPTRPTLQLTPGAMAELNRNRPTQPGARRP